MWKSKRMQNKKRDNVKDSEKKNSKKSSKRRINETQENTRNDDDRRNNRRNDDDRRNNRRNDDDRRNNRRNNDDRRNNRRNNDDRRNNRRNNDDRRNNRRYNDDRRNNRRGNINYGGKNYSRENVTKIKMSYLPHDVTYRELRDLIENEEWGKIGNIKINTYDNQYDKVTVAYIDFYNENEADYFVSAINGSRNIDPNYRILLEVKKLDN